MSFEWQGLGRKGCLSAWSLGPEAGLWVLKTEKPLPAEGAAQTGFRSIRTLQAPASYPGPGLLPLPPQLQGQSLVLTLPGWAQAGGGVGQDGALRFCQVAEAPKDALLAEPCGILVLFSYKGQSEKRGLVA